MAGVDYAVGPNPGVTLQDPNTLVISGVTVDAPNHTLVVTDDDVTINGVDCTLNGGWTIHVNAVANTTILNIAWDIGANNQQCLFTAIGSSNTILRYFSMNCRSKDVGNGAPIEYHGNGWVIEYGYFIDVGADCLQQINNGNSVVFRYNLIANAGMAGGGVHGDYTQLAGGLFVITIDFNTTKQTGGATQGLMTEFQLSGSTSNNTMIGDGGQPSFFISVDKSNLVGQYRVEKNYWHNPGNGFCYSGSPNSGFPGDGDPLTIFAGNVDMMNGPSGNDA